MFPGLPAVEPPVDQVDEMVADDKELRKMSITSEHQTGMRERRWGFEARLNPNVTLEEYMYWAKIEREMEKIEFKEWKAANHTETAIGALTSNIKGLFRKKGAPNNTGVVHDGSYAGSDGQQEKTLDSSKDSPMRAISPPNRQDLDAEWRTAARALRTASWAGVFYLYACQSAKVALISSCISLLTCFFL